MSGGVRAERTAGDAHRCGLVAIVGRPNVGKSTYLNAAVGHKISITSRKPQTTRYRVLGVRTTDRAQIVYVDTPGFQARPRRRLNSAMHREIQRALDGVDLILLFVEASRWTAEDEAACRRVTGGAAPVILVVNKIDRLHRRDELLPYLEAASGHARFAEIVPISARLKINVERLESCIVALLPEGAALFPADQLTDRSERFLAAEMIREKLMRMLGDELPYSVSVMTEEFEERDNLIRIGATIWVERDAQKPIVIGERGGRLKMMASLARRDLEGLFGRPVHLRTWVKLKERWADDARALRRLGFEP
jgi:GTP-binding protein Era